MTEESGARVSSDVPSDDSQTRQRCRLSCPAKTLIPLSNLNFVFLLNPSDFSLDFLPPLQNFIILGFCSWIIDFFALVLVAWRGVLGFLLSWVLSHICNFGVAACEI